MRGNFQGNQLPPLELSGLPTSPPTPSQVDLIALGVLNFPEQKRAREGGRRDRVSRGGGRAGQRGEREPGQSEGKEVQRNEREVGSTRTLRQREPPRDEVGVPGPKNSSPREAGGVQSEAG